MTGGVPGGYGATNAPMPVRKPNNTGCLIWGAVGCGGLIVLFIVAIVAATSTATKDNGFRRIFDSSLSAPQRGQTLATIQDALERYKRDHQGQYPPTLEALVPQYLRSRSMLAANEDGTHLEYTPPTPRSPGDAPVVSIDCGEFTVMGQQRVHTYVRLLKDGTIVQDQNQRVVLPMSRYRNRGRNADPDEDE